MTVVHVVAGVRREAEGLAGAPVHRHRAGRIDLAVGRDVGGQAVGVDGKGHGNGVFVGDVGEGVAARAPRHEGAVHHDGVHVIAGVRREAEGLAGAPVHRHRVGRIDLAVGRDVGGQAVGVDGKGHGDGVFGGDVGEGVAAGRPVHEGAVHHDGVHVIAGVRREAEGLVGAPVHRHRVGRIDLAVGRDVGGQAVGVDGKGHGNGVFVGDVGEGVVAGRAVHEVPSTMTVST